MSILEEMATVFKRKVLIFGHSQSRNLNDFVASDVSKANFGMHLQDVEVRCEGYGGLKLKDLIDYQSGKFETFDSVMNEFSPQLLVLLIADNDINSDSSAMEITSLYSEVISMIRNRYQFVKKIALTQLLPRHQNRWVDFDMYNSQCAMVNNKLLTLAQNDPDLFFKHLNFSFPSENRNKFLKEIKYFRTDGVHLNHKGYYLMYKAVRHVLISVK